MKKINVNYDIYIQADGGVFGLGKNELKSKSLNGLGKSKKFTIKNKKLYTSDIVFNEETGEFLEEFYEHDKTFSRKVSTFPEPKNDNERFTGILGDFRIEQETYEGDPISVIYKDDKREPFHMVSDAILSSGDLIFSLKEGRGASRSPGVYLWDKSKKFPERISEYGFAYNV